MARMGIPGGTFSTSHCIYCSDQRSSVSFVVRRIFSIASRLRRWTIPRTNPRMKLVSDRVRGLLYASLGPSRPSAGQIAVIDPVTGLLQDTIPVQGGAERLELADVRAITQAVDGTIWFAMNGGGLGRLRDGTLKQFRKRDGLSEVSVTGIA